MTQAVLLEKAVSGYDASIGRSSLLDIRNSAPDLSADAKTKPMKRSKLLADPRPPAPAPPAKSGLDAVILLDVSDEQCLLRAAEFQREFVNTAVDPLKG